MRIKNFTLAIAIISAFAILFQQKSYSQVYQLENPGFEQWDGGSADEPTGWNSYPSGNCTMTGLAALGCSTAKQKRHERSTDKRPGSTGQYSCRIYSKSILGVVANGALTSGQMQLATTTLTDPDNGNRTLTGNNEFNHRLNAKPDSIVFWAKAVNASDQSLSCCHLYIHDNYNLQDPLGGNSDGYQSHIVGKVPAYNFTNNGSTWQRHSAPIIYSGCQSDNPQFILITFSTNAIPGGGAGNDELYIDDIELIYNANLSSIMVNGRNVPNFDQNTTDYYVNVDCGESAQISAVTASPRASYTTSLSADGSTETITVTHGDKEKTYTIHYRGVKTTQVADHICKGDSYNQNGFTIPIQNNTGIFSFSNSYPLLGGCDSVVELSLNVHNTYTTNVDLTICESSPYNFHGEFLNQTGTYQKILTSQYGCDSTVILNLVVDNHYEVPLYEHICEGEVYNGNGFEGRTNEEPVTLNLTATNGCDSIVTLFLEVGRIDNLEFNDTIEVDNYYSNINYGFATDTTYYIYIDSTLSVHLDTAKAPKSDEFGHRIEWSINDSYLSVDSIVYISKTFTNSERCDSIVTLILKILPKPFIPEPEVEEVPENVTFEVFPSPTSTGQITIRANYDIMAELYEYNIFNEQGMLMTKGIIMSHDTIIDVSNYRTGNYYLRVIFGDLKDQKKRKAVKFTVVN